MEHRKIELACERSFGEIISDSILFIKQHFKPLFTPLLYICSAFIVLSIITGILHQTHMIRLYGLDRGVSMANFNPELLSWPTSSFTSIGIYLFFYILAYTSVVLVTLCYIKLYYEGGHQVPTKEAVWASFKSRILTFCVISLVYTFLQILGFALCLLPGFYLIPIISLSFVAVVLDSRGLGDALSRASDLVRNNWWRTFGILIVVYIIVSASSYLLALPAQVLMLSSLFVGESGGLVLTGGILNVIIQSLAIFLYVLFVVAAALCYFNLQEQKEGVGLMARIDAFDDAKSADTQRPEEEY